MKYFISQTLYIKVLSTNTHKNPNFCESLQITISFRKPAYVRRIKHFYFFCCYNHIHHTDGSEFSTTLIHCYNIRYYFFIWFWVQNFQVTAGIFFFRLYKNLLEVAYPCWSKLWVCLSRWTEIFSSLVEIHSGFIWGKYEIGFTFLSGEVTINASSCVNDIPAKNIQYAIHEWFYEVSSFLI